MNETKIMKIFIHNQCPGCGEKLIVSFKTMVPIVDWIMKEKDVLETKENVIKKIENETSLSEDRKATIIQYLQREDTLFGPDDVESLLNQLLDKPIYEKSKKVSHKKQG